MKRKILALIGATFLLGACGAGWQQAFNDDCKAKGGVVKEGQGLGIGGARQTVCDVDGSATGTQGGNVGPLKQ